MNNNESCHKTSINWYPGHMAKTKREIKENLKLIDVVYEIIDARIPYSSKIKDADEVAKNKKRIIIMTKYDLCDKSITDKWIKKYENDGYIVLPVDLTNNRDYKSIINVTKKNVSNKLGDIRVLVMGIPNVGKSTLINALVGHKVAKTANQAGVTKNLNWLKTPYGITLMDTPGILWPKIDDINVGYNLAIVGSIKQEILPLNDVCFIYLEKLSKNYPEILSRIYKSNSKDAYEIFADIALTMGAIKDDEVDYHRVSNRVYNDFISGKVKGVTLDEYN